MATNFRNYLTAAVGTATTVVYNPVTAGIQSTVIGLVLANITTNPITVTVTLTSGANTVNIIKNTVVSSGNSLDIMNSGARLVVEQGGSISVISSVPASLDVTVSTVEVI